MQRIDPNKAVPKRLIFLVNEDCFLWLKKQNKSLNALIRELIEEAKGSKRKSSILSTRGPFTRRLNVIICEESYRWVSKISEKFKVTKSDLIRFLLEEKRS